MGGSAKFYMLLVTWVLLSLSLLVLANNVADLLE